MTWPPIDQDSPQLWMTVSDVFHIKGRGTVLTGRLEGTGRLSIGDNVTCQAASWRVSGIETFRASLETAEPGSDIGVLLSNGPAGDMLRGVTVQFAPGTSTGPNLQFTPLAPKKKRWGR